MFPDDLIPRATQILLPQWTTPDERSAWLAQAFFLAEPRLYNDLRVLNGQPIIILTNTITALLEAGCLPNKKAHTLAQLLTSVRIIATPEAQSEIDRLVLLLNNACAETKVSTNTSNAISTIGNKLSGVANSLSNRPQKPLQSYETPLSERTPTVFISYSHADNNFALRLINDLQNGGHAVWIDKMNIKGGAEWVRSIADGISNSYAFVSVLSPDANISRWVQREYLYADNLGKPIFPVMAKPSEVPFQMIDRQVLSLVDDYMMGLTDLLTVLPAPRVIIITPEMEQPAPPPPAAKPLPSKSMPAPAPQAPPMLPPMQSSSEEAKSSSMLGGFMSNLRDRLFGGEDAASRSEPAAPPAPARGGGIDKKRRDEQKDAETEKETPYGGGEADEFGAPAMEAEESLPGGLSDALDDLLSIPAPITRPRAPITRLPEESEPIVGEQALTSVDRRALELMYINRVAVQRLDAMAEMDAPTPDDRVRVKALGQQGFTTNEADWATVERQLPDSGGATALSLRRVMVIGDDLQDSMSAVWAAAAALSQRAKLDPSQPIPLVVDMSRWEDEMALDDFIQDEMGELGVHLNELLYDKRAALLFDNLYRLTPERLALVDSFIAAHPDLMAVVDMTKA